MFTFTTYDTKYLINGRNRIWRNVSIDHVYKSVKPFTQNCTLLDLFTQV